MFDILSIISLVGSCVQIGKESHTQTIPAENWENKELYRRDIINGVPIEQRMKNLENGKYKSKEVYPEPHRDANGKIVIENNLLYKEDLLKYGSVQTMKWVEQGKYNLSPDELKKEHERLQNRYKKLYSIGKA